MKITADSGLAFFIRAAYLKAVDADKIAEGTVFNGEAEDDIVNAGTTLSAERKAYDYLMRAEHSRLMLERKLAAKNFAPEHIAAALDYLEGETLLSDERFARAWLNTRKIAHSEGRTKLERELYARGIAKTLAAAALDEFYANNSEEELCLRAYEKCRRLQKSDEKTVKRLLACGFPYKTVKWIMKEAEDGTALPQEELNSDH
ncbi:MAG: regulatory protein RecX [Treponema sp.]